VLLEGYLHYHPLPHRACVQLLVTAYPGLSSHLPACLEILNYLYPSNALHNSIANFAHSGLFPVSLSL
jgi:hypothetical protein